MRIDRGWILALADLAATQWGLLTAAQAGGVGVSVQQLKRLADGGLLERLRHGVYRIAGSPASPDDPLRAEWLAFEPARTAGDRIADEVPLGVVSHRSAARLQELGDLDADLSEFTVPRRRGTRSREVGLHVAELRPEDWRLANGLPVTRPLRTVVDLAEARVDGGHLALIVRDAILGGDTTRAELEEHLRPFAHHYGAPLGAGRLLVDSFIRVAGVPAGASDLLEMPDPP
ncbi:type IV toxin-antitoxin system AbiEi family antitoxin domain-containing protein [Nocardia sp. NPDC057353]|uniref:type IV toxin-antitoxin system AbiEi family antitoxin domain-containing protein n=1 Tax=Nocardia sp. NPDC057353 TaxID=3346104 RepID=UPI00363A42D5